MNGILNVYKPKGITSFSVVSRVRKFSGEKRIGHTGTLDPMATGVLVLLLGKAATLQSQLTDHDKTYVAGIRLGTKTDTGDVTGSVIHSEDVDIGTDKFCACLETFIGKQEQVPPMYSAIQVDGQRLYDLARKGIEIERRARPIEVYSAKLLERCGKTDFLVEIACSKGTYIRTLCEDIGTALGTCAVLFSLERTVCGDYVKEKSISLDELEALYKEGKGQNIQDYLLSVEPLFSQYRKVVLSEFYSRLCLNGCEVYLSKAGISPSVFADCLCCRLYTHDNIFIGVGELLDFPDGKAIKLRHRFV